MPQNLRPCAGRAKSFAAIDYQTPFPLTGTISKVDFKLGPSQMQPEDSKPRKI